MRGSTLCLLGALSLLASAGCPLLVGRYIPVEAGVETDAGLPPPDGSVDGSITVDGGLDAGRGDRGTRDTSRSDTAHDDTTYPESVRIDAVLADRVVAEREVPDAAQLDSVVEDSPTPEDASAGADASGEDTGIVDPLGLIWVSIPAGSFEMGCSVGDSECDIHGYEEPRHSVTVTTFHLMAREITQAQYLAVMGASPSYHHQCAPTDAGVDCCPDCPVESITWQQASDFCQLVGGRLPSEAEWEYAARAGEATKFSCGDDEACLDAIAWHQGNSAQTTQPVGNKLPNDFGLYDMHGNVCEWVADCWNESYNGAPTDGSVWQQGDCSRHVYRGGGYSNTEPYMRVTLRWGGYPIASDKGARCCR